MTLKEQIQQEMESENRAMKNAREMWMDAPDENTSQSCRATWNYHKGERNAYQHVLSLITTHELSETSQFTERLYTKIDKSKP